VRDVGVRLENRVNRCEILRFQSFRFHAAPQRFEFLGTDLNDFLRAWSTHPTGLAAENLPVAEWPAPTAMS
jgi:hypothetical protein